MTCYFDSRWIGKHGIGRFAYELHERLPVQEFNCNGRPMSPIDTLRLSCAFKNIRHGQWFLSPGYNAPLFTLMPYVLTIHDLNHIDRPDNSSFFKKIYYSSVLKSLCRRAKAVLTVSDFSRDRIIAWSGLNPNFVFNVGNGVSEIFTPRGYHQKIEGGYLLCVSNRRGHKNETGMLKAFAQTRLPKSTKLVLTGESTSHLLNLAAKLGISDRLIFSGRISEEGLAALYRGALFLVFPSFYEGFGLPIVEAFACGTPVITSNLTSMPEIAEDAALLVNPNDVSDIAAAIDKLYDSTELRAELIKRGFKRAANFTWDAVANRVKAAIKIVDTDPARPLSWN